MTFKMSIPRYKNNYLEEEQKTQTLETFPNATLSKELLHNAQSFL